MLAWHDASGFRELHVGDHFFALLHAFKDNEPAQEIKHLEGFLLSKAQLPFS